MAKKILSFDDAFLSICENPRSILEISSETDGYYALLIQAMVRDSSLIYDVEDKEHSLTYLELTEEEIKEMMNAIDEHQSLLMLISDEEKEFKNLESLILSTYLYNCAKKVGSETNYKKIVEYLSKRITPLRDMIIRHARGVYNPEAFFDACGYNGNDLTDGE
ncbi:MAG: hypothetical protein E7374_03260 [Clostridiales bacterium]|nr:hypothetical protein [Clostridiales bacterium]